MDVVLLGALTPSQDAVTSAQYELIVPSAYVYGAHVMMYDCGGVTVVVAAAASSMAAGRARLAITALFCSEYVSCRHSVCVMALGTRIRFSIYMTLFVLFLKTIQES